MLSRLQSLRSYSGSPHPVQLTDFLEDRVGLQRDDDFIKQTMFEIARTTGHFLKNEPAYSGFGLAGQGSMDSASFAIAAPVRRPMTLWVETIQTRQPGFDWLLDVSKKIFSMTTVAQRIVLYERGQAAGNFDHQPHDACQTGQDSGAHRKGFGQSRIGERQADDPCGGEQAHRTAVSGWGRRRPPSKVA